MKKSLLKTIALTSVLTMAFPLFSACGRGNEDKAEAASHVAIDVNPSFSLTLDEDNKVIAVHAENEDAQILFYGEALVGLELQAALDKVAELSVDLGFVNEDNYGVNVNVSGKIGESDVVAKLDAAFDKESGEFDINVSASGTFSDIRELEALKEKYLANVDIQNLTIADYKLIAEAQMIDGTISAEEAVKMGEEKLMEIIAEGAIAIEPYATKAYNLAVGVAQRAYNELKGQLLDSLWTIPYVKDYANILTGMKYTVNNGALYNMYTASSRALGVSIDAIEKAIEIANETAVPAATLDNIATALNLDEAQKEAFIAEVSEGGKATLASVEKYLNRWFKNLTEEQRAQLQATVDSLIADVQSFAVEIENAIAVEYKNAITKLVSDINSLIPESLKTLAGAYIAEFENLVAKISNATTEKEPLVAVKAVKEVFDEEAERLMQTMRAELTEEDLASVEESIAKVQSTLEGYEKNFADAKAKAEADAKAWLEAEKAKRQK